MADRQRATDKNPSTGALPSEQTAANAVEQKKGRSDIGLSPSDQAIYKIVENAVDYAGDQFGQNLKFNSETLTNVLYDNIYKLLGDKFNEDEFAQTIADKLLDNGCVVQISDNPTGGGTTEKAVESISPEQYQDLQTKVDAAIKIIQANNPAILKAISEIGSSNTSENLESLRIGDKQINQILGRIKGDQKVFQGHLENQQNARQKMDNVISLVSERLGQFKQFQDSRNAQMGKAEAQINGLIGKIGGGGSRKSIGGGRKKIGQGGMGFPLMAQTQKRKKQGRISLIVGKIGKRIGTFTSKLKKKISDSPIGKAWRALKFVAKAIWKTVKFAGKVIKTTIKAAWKTAKGFYKASKFTGKAVVGMTKMGVSAFKTMFGLKTQKKKLKSGNTRLAQGLRNAKAAMLKTKMGKALARNGYRNRNPIVKVMNNFSPARVITKMGWGAIKFVGKSIWKGIKKLALKAWDGLKSMFRIAGKFVNKVANWSVKIGRGIKNTATRFLIKPLASLMVTTFSFVVSLVASPVQFIKWLATSVFDRIHDVLNGILHMTRRVVRSTLGIFKKILTNPLSIMLIIGAIAYFLIPKIIGWFSGGVEEFKEKVLPKLMSFIHTTVDILKAVGSVVFNIGKVLFKVVNWITDPNGYIAKALVFTVKAFLEVKRFIKKMMKATGKNNIDILCRFIAGDTIGIAISMIGGMCIKAWRWFAATKFGRFVVGLIKSLVSLGQLIFDMQTVLWKSLGGAAWQIIKGNLGGVIDAICKPWVQIWDDVKELVRTFKGASAQKYGDKLVENPLESAGSVASRSNIAVRSLSMKGTVEKNLEFFENMARTNGYATKDSILQRMQAMNRIHQMNAEQVMEYENFMKRVWESGKGNDDVSAATMKALLESPELSQKLLSAFFYYNPQTGKTMTLRPVAYIGQFVKNIQQMVSDPDRDGQETFKTIVEAFDQVNKERANYVNNHGKIMSDFAEKMAKFNRSNKDAATNGLVEIRNMLVKFNKGDLFDNIKVSDSFKASKNNDDLTEDVKSVTGSSFGNNKLFRVEDVKSSGGAVVGDDVKDYEIDVPKEDDKAEKVSGKPEDMMSNIVFPPEMNPSPIPPPEMLEDKDGKTMIEKWREHQDKRAEMISKGMDTDEVDKMGFEALTFDEFLKKYKEENPPTAKETEEMEENKSKRRAALVLAHNIGAFHNQGKAASVEGFKMGKTPSIIKIETDDLQHNMYMYSPEWQKMQGAAKISDDEILLKLDAGDKEAAERIKKAKEAEKAKKQEEERQRQREQEILDYSAKVEGGFIEVKVGEDTQAMWDAYDVHMKKVAEAIAKGVDTDKLEEMGLYNYTPDEWQRYYRKMHGIPEDGIKRIPFEGKRKERQIDWNARFPLSSDELSKYGIQMSEEGPVMIPLDNAMAAASDILKGAKTIYGIRDGLEVMRKGLDSETQNLKQRREGGIPVAMVQSGGFIGGETPLPLPPEQVAGYSQTS